MAPIRLTPRTEARWLESGRRPVDARQLFCPVIATMMMTVRRTMMLLQDSRLDPSHRSPGSECLSSTSDHTPREEGSLEHGASPFRLSIPRILPDSGAPEAPASPLPG